MAMRPPRAAMASGRLHLLREPSGHTILAASAAICNYMQHPATVRACAGVPLSHYQLPQAVTGGGVGGDGIGKNGRPS